MPSFESRIDYSIIATVKRHGVHAGKKDMYNNCNYKNPNMVRYDRKELRSKKFRFLPGCCFGHCEEDCEECRKCRAMKVCRRITDSKKGDEARHDYASRESTAAIAAMIDRYRRKKTARKCPENSA